MSAKRGRKPKKEDARPKVQDLVALTGYSQGAISRAFNGGEGISDSTREKILKAAREIGYHPNPSARNFKRGYSGRIGIILPNLSNSNYSELYEHLDLINTEAGLSTILALTHNSQEVEADTMLHWSAGETDAFVVNPVPDMVNLPLYLKLKSWRFPILFLYESCGEQFDSLTIDYRMSMRQAMSYLRDVGHKKVSYVGTGMKDRPVGKHAMFIEWAREFGLVYDEELSVIGVDGDVAGQRAFSHWRLKGQRPTAIVAFNDHTAMSIISEAEGEGIRIPEEMSILGSDDIASAKAVGLSTIRVDRLNMAKTIDEILRNRMKDFDSPIQLQRMTSELVVRRTMGPPKKR
ncbi:LacI family DNA-binding transcriptional regulator [Cerasicoccus fimbriatus]|uniref:LacI family DNA-binding transcriptional regulator n=1 Tax=Cerasicoccus fimbriatus TaxID=3014554 RepID=UPI0022B2ADD7|nr:LacI family DNA-binding transcriptional regulator [Cerasicoccus sp. TK19100]